MNNNNTITDIKEIEISKIKNNPLNPRTKYDFDELNILKDSLRINGQLTPIIIDENNTLLSGHRRLRAATEIGWKTIKYQRKTGLTTFNKSAVLISSNATQASFNAWDMRDAISRIYWEEFLEEYTPTSNVDKGYSAFAKSVGISTTYIKRIVESALPENKKLFETAKKEEIGIETFQEILTARPEMRKELLAEAVNIKKKHPEQKSGRIREFIRGEKRKARISEEKEVTKSTIVYFIKRIESLSYELSDDLINKSKHEDLKELASVLENTFVKFYFKVKKELK